MVGTEKMRKTDVFDIAASICAKASRGELGKLRYKRVYEKAVEYAKINHHGGKCSYPVKTSEGWSCVINGDRNIVLYITEKDGELSFWEKEI